MICYPIVISTLCRYEHFKRCVESLQCCTHAEETELFIGLDYPQKDDHWEGYRLLCEYIPTIKGFKNVICFKREHNWGAIKNIRDLIKYAFAFYDAVILSEDDNEFSPCFLDYMNQALEMYKDEKRVVSVSGYTHIEHEGIAQNNVLFTYDNNAWGLGLWRDKEEKNVVAYQYYINIWKSNKDFWKLFIVSPAIAHFFSVMICARLEWGDVMCTVKNIREKTFQVRPYKSLVRNCGYDGSGLHCEVDRRFLKQEILCQDKFALEKCPICNTIPYNVMFYFQLSDNLIKAWYFIFRYFIFYYKNRLRFILK